MDSFYKKAFSTGTCVVLVILAVVWLTLWGCLNNIPKENIDLKQNLTLIFVIYPFVVLAGVFVRTLFLAAQHSQVLNNKNIGCGCTASAAVIFFWIFLINRMLGGKFGNLMDWIMLILGLWLGGAICMGMFANFFKSAPLPVLRGGKYGDRAARLKKYHPFLSKSERENHPISHLSLHFVWSVSRNRETYGCNIVTLRTGFNREKVASTCGSAYDMRGVVLADFIKLHFAEELKYLDSDDFYGLSFWNPEIQKCHRFYREGDIVRLDGKCGFDNMERILNKIGFSLRFIGESRSESTYMVNAI